MRIHKKLYTLALGLANILFVNSEATFKVIAISGTPSVVINGAEHQMTVDTYPIYKAVVDVNPNISYHYSIVYEDQTRAEEQFERTLTTSSTLNEFFDRQITVKEHPLLPRAYEEYTKSDLSKLFDDTHVSTILIRADQAGIDNLHQHPDQKLRVYGAEVIYVNPHIIRTFANATIGISGQSTVFADKLSYKISDLENEKNQELFKRSAIKLRAENMDPSFLRDKIYGDMLNSLGVPTAQNKHTRLFINGQPIGLFVLSDDVSSKRYLREMLNHGERFSQPNILFKADYYPTVGYGDLGYYGEDSPMYSIYYYKGENDEEEGINVSMQKQHLIPFLFDINNYPAQPLNLDINMFLKFMAMEYVAGAIDNYWIKPGNYFIYKDVTANTWYFLDNDFHYTFGAGGQTIDLLNSNIDNYAACNLDLNTTARPLLDHVRQSSENEAYFMNIFKRLLETVFNINSIGPRIDSLADLIREDAYWDFSLTRVNQYQGTETVVRLPFTGESFEEQVSSETASPDKMDLFPLKYWIITKGHQLADILQIEYPSVIDNSLGNVVTPSHLESLGFSNFNINARIWLTVVLGLIFYLYL